MILITFAEITYAAERNFWARFFPLWLFIFQNQEDEEKKKCHLSTTPPFFKVCYCHSALAKCSENIFQEFFLLNKSSVRHLHGRWCVDGGRHRVVMNGTTALWTTLYEQTIRMTFSISFERCCCTGGMGRVGELQKVSMIERGMLMRWKKNVESEKCTCLTFFLDFFFSVFVISIVFFFCISQTTDIRHTCGYDQVNWLSVWLSVWFSVFLKRWCIIRLRINEILFKTNDILTLNK